MDYAKFRSMNEDGQEDLRRQTKISEFVIRYTPELCDLESEEYVFWRTHVVPSCVPGKSQRSFTCVFCGRQISSPAAIRRHYMEQHYAYIPEGIFGTRVRLECEQCGISFARKLHLTSHMSSELHEKCVRQKAFEASRPEVKSSFFANCLAEERAPFVEGGSASAKVSAKGPKAIKRNLGPVDSGYESLNSTLAYLDAKWSEELAADPLMPRSSTKLSALVENLAHECSHSDDGLGHDVTVTASPEDEVEAAGGGGGGGGGELCKSGSEYASVKNKSFPVYARGEAMGVKRRKAVDKADLSDAFFQNLSFNE
jgi:hypothetical protein